jgi:hypothetical protein
MNAARYLFIEEARILGSPGEETSGLLLKEQPDGSWRKPDGEDLKDLHRRFPRFIRSIQDWRPNGASKEWRPTWAD